MKWSDVKWDQVSSVAAGLGAVFGAFCFRFAVTINRYVRNVDREVNHKQKGDPTLRETVNALRTLVADHIAATEDVTAEMGGKLDRICHSIDGLARRMLDVEDKQAAWDGTDRRAAKKPPVAKKAPVKKATDARARARAAAAKAS